MKLKCVLYFIFIVLTLSAVSTQADAPVWKVSKGEQNLYLAGTFHLLKAEDYPLPSQFSEAYAKASTVVLETDIRAAQSASFQQQLLARMMYLDGSTLKSKLKPETFSALENYLAQRNIPINNFLMFKPAMVVLSLSVMEMQSLGYSGAHGVDNYFSGLAAKDGKALGFLEPLESQLDFLASMGEGQEDEMIMYNLKELSQINSLLSQLKTHWRNGDNEQLVKITVTPWKKDFPDVYQSLLVERNNAWLPHIESMLNDDQVELVLVGALHLVGDDGLLSLLEKRGYEVTKFK